MTNRATRRPLPWSGAVMMAGVLALGAPFAAPEAEASPLAAPVEVEVDLSDRELRVIGQNGETVRSYRVAIGSANHATPPGSYTLDRIIWNPRWVPPPNREWARGAKARAPGDPANPMQVAKIYFREPWYYIHGTNAPESMGEAASRGCIRMRPEDVRDLGLLLMRETGHERGEGWVESVLAGNRSEEIRLPRPVRFTIRR
jgi:L,D-transpeptidase ErfK/SrfK